MGELQRKLPSHISRIYYPIDFKGSVSRALNSIRPEAIVLVEAEIWPNFLWRAKSMQIPVFLVNARLSDRSFPRYARYRFLFKDLFASFAGVGAQSEADSEKLRKLGCRPENVHVVGSLKYDAAKLEERRLVDVPNMLRQLGVAEGARVLVAGSTHAGEESLIAESFKRLRQRFPDLFLIVVPRHFERSREVGRELEAQGIKFAYRNEITQTIQYPPHEMQCLVVNTTGELKHFYQSATVIFVGKSLTAQGGQNPIEPGAMGKAMVFGPNMQNFAEVARSFITRGAAIQVANAAELEGALGDLLSDPSRRELMGHQALTLVRENLGGIERTVDMFVNHFEGGDLYIAPKKEIVVRDSNMRLA